MLVIFWADTWLRRVFDSPQCAHVPDTKTVPERYTFTLPLIFPTD